MSEHAYEHQSGGKGYYKCPVCADIKRSDHMKTHLFQHRKELMTVMNGVDLQKAVAEKIPILWKFKGKKVSPEDFAVCLVCKKASFAKERGETSVREFFDSHLKSPCRKQWRDVCSHFGVNVLDEPPAQSDEPNPVADKLRYDIQLFKDEITRKDGLIRQKDALINTLTDELEAKTKYANNLWTENQEKTAQIIDLSEKVKALPKPTAVTHPVLETQAEWEQCDDCECPETCDGDAYSCKPCLRHNDA